VDPKTGQPLRSWDAALAAIDADSNATPAHVARLGRIDARGINDGHPDAERSIRYVTKYVTKDIAETGRAGAEPQRAHFDRLHAELATLPCAPTCANWLLYGIQPNGARAGLVPGRCNGKVHQRDTLCFTGRRVLVSRNWSTKTLKDLRADNAGWVRTVLAANADDETTSPSPTDTGAPERDAVLPPDRYAYQLARPDDPDVLPYQHRILAAIAARDRWRSALAAVRRRTHELSATASDSPAALAA
jgi:hypothetical protein